MLKRLLKRKESNIEGTITDKIDTMMSDISVMIDKKLEPFQELLAEPEEEEENNIVEVLQTSIQQAIRTEMETIGIFELVDTVKSWQNFNKTIPAEYGKASKVVRNAIIDEQIAADPILSAALDMGLVSKPTIKKIAKNPIALDILKNTLMPKLETMMGKVTNPTATSGSGYA